MTESFGLIQNWLKDHKNYNLHPFDAAMHLKCIYEKDEKVFKILIARVHSQYLGELLLYLPEAIKNEAFTYLPSKQLALAVNELESDDATDLLQDLEHLNAHKKEEVLKNIDQNQRKDIEKLDCYEEDAAGSFMQTEYFWAKTSQTINEAVLHLKALKENGQIEHVSRLFVESKTGKFIGSVDISDLITIDFNTPISEVLRNVEVDKFWALDTEKIDDVAHRFEQYDISVMPVLNAQYTLVGRITSDDIYDVLETQATEQIYNLAGVNDDEEDGNVKEMTQSRGIWLTLNLLTAILASTVIGIFDKTIAAFVPLAILMPIVASMGGNAGTQSLTVIVRKLALGEIGLNNTKNVIQKECLVSLINGTIFGVVMSIVGYFWFGQVILGAVLFCSMLINLFCAGFFGACIPLLLKKIGVDPASGSAVLLTTVTDIIGFFSFLGLASLVI